MLSVPAPFYEFRFHFRENNYCAKRPYVRERKIRLTKICSFRFRFRPESNCFLRRGYGGVFTARRRWRFDTSIFRISKVDPPTNTLAVDTDMFMDPFLDHFFGNFLNFENHRIDVRGVMIEIKVQFGDSLETILSASTTNVFSVFDPF